MLSPVQVVLARCHAFVAGEFSRVYELHHPDSFFRRLYPSRDGYLDYARDVLGRDFKIRECRILKEETTAEEARVIYYLDIAYRSERLESFEYCHLRQVAGEWLLLSTQKIERSEFPGAPESIDWDDFERQQDRIVY